MGITRRLAVPALPHHIVNVVLVCAEKQMVWVAARRHIARVAYEHPCRYVSNEVFVGNAMGSVGWFAPATSPDDAVTEAVNGACEYPTPREGYSDYAFKNAINAWFHVFSSTGIQARQRGHRIICLL